METEPLQIRLAVRELVEFVLRRGSIDSRFSGFDRANEGSRIHRKLQKAAELGIPVLTEEEFKNMIQQEEV